jgi:protein-disulfide isomerase
MIEVFEMKRFLCFTAIVFLLTQIPAGFAYGTEVSGEREDQAPLSEEMKAIRKELSEIKKEIKDLKTLINSRLTQKAQPQPRPTTGHTAIRDDPFIGSPDAPLVLVEFSDYQCPFCAKFFRNTLPRIKKEYIDTGKVKYVFKDFPLKFHKQAQKAAEAAHCAGEEGQYWELHDILFENQARLAKGDLMDHARKLGLNVEAFERCLDDNRFADGIKKDMEAGKKDSGVTGTPSFVLGRVNDRGEVEGEIIRGARPYEAFKDGIDALLKEGPS